VPNEHALLAIHLCSLFFLKSIYEFSFATLCSQTDCVNFPDLGVKSYPKLHISL